MKLPSYLSGILILTSLLVGSLSVHAQDTKKDKDAEKSGGEKGSGKFQIDSAGRPKDNE